MTDERYVPERLGVWPEDLGAALLREQEAMNNVLDLIRQLYAIHCVGGPLHSVLDDGNIDGVIRPYYRCYGDVELDVLYVDGTPIAELHPEAPAVVNGEGRSMRQLCEAIAAALNAMSEEERELVLALHHRGNR